MALSTRRFVLCPLNTSVGFIPQEEVLVFTPAFCFGTNIPNLFLWDTFFQCSKRRDLHGLQPGARVGSEALERKSGVESGRVSRCSWSPGADQADLAVFFPISRVGSGRVGTL